MEKFNTQGRFFRRFRALCLIVVMLLAAGCSSMRLAYNQGDTLLYWWLNAYLDLDADQGEWVRQDIDRIFQWHRKSQLKDYAQLLATGQRQLAGNLTEAELMADYREIKARTDVLALKAVPELAELAHSVRPEQIAKMEKKFRSKNEDYRDKFLSGDTEKRQKQRFKKSMQQLELWFGNFSSAQEAVLRKVSDARPLNNEIWYEERLLRQKKIVALLRKVQQEKLGKEQTAALVEQLVKDILGRFDAPERKAFFDASIGGTIQMILTAVRIATPEQKAHAQRRMQGWIDDFKELAAEPQ
ncbi:MAG: DUF6279 family lipoprotein [Telluria sp.]|nr:DUF6279 family lipoprotein [Telluria sp.]